MDDKLKQKLDDALKNGKLALDDIQGIIKNITKDVMEKSKDSGEDLKITSSELFKEIVNSLSKVGKGTFEFLKAASDGFVEGVKASTNGDKNLVQDAGKSLGESLKALTDAGIYVTQETAKNIGSILENLFKKKDEPKEEKDETNSNADSE